MNNIKLLDCTLRDGGHVTQGKFGASTIKAIISNLVQARIDIIEVGFLWASDTDCDTARYTSIKEVKQYLPKDMGVSKVSLMADNVDLTNLEPCDGTVDIIRLSFRKNEVEWVKKAAEVVISKGYKCYINPIHGSAVSDQEYLDIIKMVNEIKPYGFSIVDTFGAMRQEDLARLYYLIDYNLDKSIELGVHLHENLGLAYSLALHILQIASPQRRITIDGSLYGMGKIPGNLCIEQIMDHLNIAYQADYVTEPAYDAIDQYVMPIYQRVGGWGYSIPYALSAQCGVHRTYAEYLSKKERLRTKDIRRLLKTISIDKSEIFDEKYIEAKYQEYMNAAYDEMDSITRLSERLNKYNDIIILAPGQSVKDLKIEKQLRDKSCVISVNFEHENIPADLCFWTNAKRIAYATLLDKSNMIITSNLKDDFADVAYIVSRNELIYHNDLWSDDSTLMLLNLLKRLGKTNVYIAGFDGFKKSTENFFDKQYEREVRDYDYDVKSRISILRSAYSSLNIQFLTPSAYESAIK